MLRRLYAGIVLAAVCLAPARMPAAIKAADLRKAAPDFSLKDSKGASVRLSNYKGKVVLLDFWATWCGGCKVEIPWFMEFETKYKGSGFAVIGVSMDADGWKLVKAFVEERKMNYAVVLGNEDVARVYGVESMPMTLLIDREGRIADSHVGLGKKDDFESEVRTLVQDKAKSAAK